MAEHQKPFWFCQQEGNQLLCPAACPNQCPACCWWPEVFTSTSSYAYFLRPPSDTWEPSKRKDIFLLPVWDQLCLSKPGGFFHYRPKRKCPCVFCWLWQPVEWEYRKNFLQLTNNLVNSKSLLYPEEEFEFTREVLENYPPYTLAFGDSTFKNLRIKSN